MAGRKKVVAAGSPAGNSDELVEQALLRRAVGFQIREEVSEEITDRDGNVLETLKHRVVAKEVPPDLRAIQFWLKNRQPERWREKVENLPETDFDFGDEELDL